MLRRTWTQLWTSASCIWLGSRKGKFVHRILIIVTFVITRVISKGIHEQESDWQCTCKWVFTYLMHLHWSYKESNKAFKVLCWGGWSLISHGKAWVWSNPMAVRVWFVLDKVPLRDFLWHVKRPTCIRTSEVSNPLSIYSLINLLATCYSTF